MLTLKLPENSTVRFQLPVEFVLIRKTTFPLSKVAWYSPAFSKSTCVPPVDNGLNQRMIDRLLVDPGLKTVELDLEK